MRAILLAPVDLLWNGGIGTYVKAGGESDADAGDKSNDAIRVDGGELRARCVGEGGNLGFTQRGRVEYARHGCGGHGGRINTDFIDNSAGVDTSDHEVNIKILLDRVVRDGHLTGEQRNQLLASMTDEVAELVLADNYEQNLALANAQAQAPALLHVHEDWMRTLERRGLLNRELEALPTRREVRRAHRAGRGATGPELSVLLAYTKIVLADDLLDSELPDDPFLRGDLYSYFPTKMRQDYRSQMEQHPLRREIIVTQLVNQLVNNAGMTYFHRLSGETAAAGGRADPGQLRLARDLRSEGPQLRDRVVRQPARRCSADPDAHRGAHPRRAGQPLARQQPAAADGHRGDGRRVRGDRREGDGSAAVVDDRPRARGVHEPPRCVGRPRRAGEPGHEGRGLPAGVHGAGDRPDRLAHRGRPARGGPRALRRRRAPRTADAGLPDPRPAARGPLADDGARGAARRPAHRARAAHGQVLAATDSHADAASRVTAWEDTERDAIARAAATFEEICSDESADLARMSVALRVVRSLIAAA